MVVMPFFLKKNTLLFILISSPLLFSSCISPNIQAPFPDDSNSGEINGTASVLASGILIPSPASTFEPDIRTYFPNPGIGWQDDHKHDEIIPLFQETVYYPVRKDISWKALNPAEGVFDWSVFDALYKHAVQNGKQFSFRVYTMVDFETGPAIPDWAVQKGIVFTPLGDPDYAGCVYQEEWGNFVNALLERYDGDPNIAFIDISGYGNYNEWSWHDHQTEWDAVWDAAFQAGEAGPATMQKLDAQARRRLADMFIGGKFDAHSCVDPSGEIVNVGYSYKGAENTQLVMPFAGIKQSTQYVFLKRPDIGFRYDCLGRDGDHDAKVDLIGDRWMTAPVVYELCADSVELEEMQSLLHTTHGSLVHNNDFSELSLLTPIISTIGYRYYVEQAAVEAGAAPGQILISMTWQNSGTAPNYPKMGQDFELHLYLMNYQNDILSESLILTDTSKWLPKVPQDIQVLIEMPSGAFSGNYYLAVSLIDKRTAKPIFLAFGEPDALLRYRIASFYYK